MIWIILYSIAAFTCFVCYLIHCVKDSKKLTLLDVVVAFIIAIAWIVTLLIFIMDCGDDIVLWRKK